MVTFFFSLTRPQPAKEAAVSAIMRIVEMILLLLIFFICLPLICLVNQVSK